MWFRPKTRQPMRIRTKIREPLEIRTKICELIRIRTKTGELMQVQTKSRDFQLNKSLTYFFLFPEALLPAKTKQYAIDFGSV